MDSFASRRSERLAGGAFVLLLHAAFLALLVQSLTHIAVPRKPSRELIFVLPRLFAPAPAKPEATPGTATRQSTPPLFESPADTTAPAAPPSALQSFGQSLSGCAPETYASLTPQQRARCSRPGEGMTIQQYPNLMGTPSHVKNNARWAAELDRKKSPFALPCYGGRDVLCLIGSIATGAITDPKTWPIYETEQYAPEDLYKIEQAYDAWHRDHPDTSTQGAGSQPR